MTRMPHGAPEKIIFAGWSPAADPGIGRATMSRLPAPNACGWESIQQIVITEVGR